MRSEQLVFFELYSLFISAVQYLGGEMEMTLENGSFEKKKDERQNQKIHEQISLVDHLLVLSDLLQHSNLFDSLLRYL